MTTPTSTPGRAIGGRYALLATVGAGGMGTVWRAHDQLLRRDVAVKEVLLPPGVPRAERQMLCERTLREARAAASLNNPCVVRIYDVVEEDDRPWIVMELVAARSLAEIINQTGPMRPELVADVGLQVLGALEAAHAAGILHRDVKPGNILLSQDGRATLTDFGVARSSGDSALTSTGLLLGSPAYIPPERARGRPAVPASDLWALGATLYAAVEGRPPYDTGDPVGTLTAIVSDPPPPFTLAGPLRMTLTGLLVKEPEHRWDVQRARDGFHDALGISRADATSNLSDGATRAFEVPPAMAPAWPPAAAPGTSPPASPPASPASPTAWQPHWPAGADAARWQGQPLATPGQAPARPSAPSAPWRRTGGVVALAIGLVVVFAGLAAAGGYYLTRDRSDTPGSGSSPSTAAVPETPAGYFRFEHPDGFSVAIPNGWQKQVSNRGIIQFNDPSDNAGGGRFLRLLVTRTESPDMETFFEGREPATKADIEGYQLVRIDETKLGSRDGGEWEYTHTRQANRHVLERGCIVEGMAYSLYLSTREEQFSSSTHILDDAARSFALT